MLGNDYKIIQISTKHQPKIILRNSENQISLFASLIILFIPLPTTKSSIIYFIFSEFQK